VTLSSASPTRPPLIQMVFDLLTTMGEFCCPHYLPGGIVDHGQSGCLATWIDFDAQRRWLDIGLGFLQDDGEGIAQQDGCMACFQQESGTTRMHGIKGFPILV
jgi:hypothetical protein